MRKETDNIGKITMSLHEIYALDTVVALANRAIRHDLPLSQLERERLQEASIDLQRAIKACPLK